MGEEKLDDRRKLDESWPVLKRRLSTYSGIILQRHSGWKMVTRMVDKNRPSSRQIVPASCFHLWRRKVPGGAAGLQNQSGGRKVPGGFDSLPSPPRKRH